MNRRDNRVGPSRCQCPGRWAFHGEKDEAVSVERTRRMVEAIKKAGGTPRYTEYKDAGHVIWEKVFHEPELQPWMFSQRRAN